MDEIYKAVPGCQGLYEVSNFGNVKSLQRGKEVIMKLDKRTTYLKVHLSINGKSKQYDVHQLVAMAFLGHQPNGHDIVVNHIDNNPLNNNVNNLELVSQRYNTSCNKTDVGTSWDKRRNKWEARIRINNKKKFLGYFDDKQDALDAYQKALDEYRCK
jgi:hypothetical protein